MSFVQALNNSSPTSEDHQVSTSSSKAAAGWANSGVLNFLANGDKSTVKIIVEVAGKQFLLDKFSVVKNAKKDPTSKSPDVFVEFDIKKLRAIDTTATSFTPSTTPTDTLKDFGF